MKQPPAKVIVHELRNEGDHRLVIIKPDGTNIASEWARTTALAQLLGFFGNNDPSNGLPPGVFTVREVAHQILA